jgi:hypothetical protein
VVTAKTYPQLSVKRLAPTEIKAQEAIALVLDTFSGEFSRSKENEFIGCISDAIRKEYPTVRIIPPDDFRRVAVPDLTHEGAPSRPWDQLMEEPEFRERIAPTGIRYVILVSGDTQWTGRKVHADWIAAEETWGRESWLKANVWDITRAQRMGEVTVTVAGETGYGALFPLIVIAVAYTETRACNEIGQAVQKFLAGESFSDTQ